MTERPLIFSAPMVRAILENRKSVTRRLADYSKWEKGDTVWVREAFSGDWLDDGILYRATMTGSAKGAKDAGYSREPKWKPSIHMPRWASRITLELTADVRREPLSVCSTIELQREGFTDGDLHSFIAAWDSMHPDHSSKIME